jgi:hypothetical protein
MPQAESGSSGNKGASTDGASSSAGGLPDAGSGTAGNAGGDDPEGAFDKSLGDFDGAIAREREGMASAGKGSGRSAEGREAGDANAVKSAAGGTGRAGRGVDSGDVGRESDTGEAGAGEPADAGTTAQGGSGAKEAGAGSPEESSAAEGTAGKGAGQQGEAAPDIPDDIPADGTGEDQVARQLREAAMAEKDPVVREALWEQYRRHTGLKK